MPNPFLSDAWLDDVEKIIEESGGGGMMPEGAQINMVVTGGPEGDRELNVNGGKFNRGLIDAPTKLTLPYDVAKDMFINGNQQAAMQAFMSGKIKVEGDMTKLMAMQGGAPADPAAAEALQKKILEITSED